MGYRRSVPGDPMFDDWVRAPNLAGDPATYELENEAIERDGRLDRALFELAPWAGRTILDIGCGAGFWLTRYAERAEKVVGIEPDPDLRALAHARAADRRSVDVLAGSAEQVPLGDASVPIAHARFAYFFGPGSEAGLAEIGRVLRPGGVLLVVDNSWRGGDFAELLRSATEGNAVIDPTATDRWWAERGAIRHEVAGAWRARSPGELERILRIEFASDVVDGFLAHHAGPGLTYRFAVHEWRP